MSFFHLPGIPMIATRRIIALLALAALPSLALAQRGPGKPIGKVTVIGNLIHLELDTGAIAPERLFDLDHRTLRFTPDGRGYRVENTTLKWDADFGPALTANSYALKQFTFPFSGKSWDSFSVATGSVTFGAAANASANASAAGGGRGGRGGGFQMERYALMQTVGATFINMVPGIAAYAKVGLNGGQRYVKELADRAVVTWIVNESAGGIQAFTWTPIANRIQATLYKTGVIELSYNDISVRDGVVGVFPMVDAGVTKTLTQFADAEDASVAAHLDVRAVKLSVVDNLFLQATIETRGAILLESDPAINGVVYRLGLDKSSTDLAKVAATWTIRGSAGGRGNAPTGYTATGPGVQSTVTVSGNTITIKGLLPSSLSDAKHVAVSVDAGSGNPNAIADVATSTNVALTGIEAAEIDLSSTKNSGPYAVAYEGFHWPSIPRSNDVTCSVIQALGDKFDFFAMYSDFRVDNPEGGTPSTGPRGGNVTGIGNTQRDPSSFCSKGQLQFMFVQPVSTAAIQIQESSPDGRMKDYNYAMSQIGHELGHRWAADAFAVVNGERIQLGPTHWAAGVHLPSAFPYSNPNEADAMGGSTWKENADGTFTQLDRDYYSPAKGYSWLALYLMGLARPEEVKPFFILRELQRTGNNDADGKPIYTGKKTVITIQDVIAANGPRLPAFDQAQKNFNTGIVVMTLPGQKPSPELIKHANDIREHWIKYWSQVTGGRSTMTVNPR